MRFPWTILSGKTHYKNIPVSRSVSREIIMSNRGYKQDISMGRNYNIAVVPEGKFTINL